MPCRIYNKWFYKYLSPLHTGFRAKYAGLFIIRNNNNNFGGILPWEDGKVLVGRKEIAIDLSEPSTCSDGTCAAIPPTAPEERRFVGPNVRGEKWGSEMLSKLLKVHRTKIQIPGSNQGGDRISDIESQEWTNMKTGNTITSFDLLVADHNQPHSLGMAYFSWPIFAEETNQAPNQDSRRKVTDIPNNTKCAVWPTRISWARGPGASLLICCSDTSLKDAGVIGLEWGQGIHIFKAHPDLI